MSDHIEPAQQDGAAQQVQEEQSAAGSGLGASINLMQSAITQKQAQQATVHQQQPYLPPQQLIPPFAQLSLQTPVIESSCRMVMRPRNLRNSEAQLLSASLSENTAWPKNGQSDTVTTVEQAASNVKNSLTTARNKKSVSWSVDAQITKSAKKILETLEGKRSKKPNLLFTYPGKWLKTSILTMIAMLLSMAVDENGKPYNGCEEACEDEETQQCAESKSTEEKKRNRIAAQYKGLRISTRSVSQQDVKSSEKSSAPQWPSSKILDLKTKICQSPGSVSGPQFHLQQLQ
uniref:Uncharacterized protein n=1 Tax=Ditylenchus dipsaci TaxID=166011 RepID=A0A915DLC9_9BILA